MALPRAWGPGVNSTQRGLISGRTPKPLPRKTPPKTPPRTPAGAAGAGLPVLESPQVTRAKANAEAWKAIERSMASLPDFNAIDQPFSAQRTAIQPLVDAHRDWLMRAGEYQTKVANGLAQLAYQAGTGAEAGAVSGAAAAGAPAGSLPATNVSATSLSTGPAAVGGSSANYLRSLVPYATAQGIGNIGRVNANEQEALNQLTQGRKEISAQYGDLADKAFTALSGSAFDKYKSELAAIAAQGTGGKGALSPADIERQRHNREMEKLRSRGYDISEAKGSGSTLAAADKASAAQTKAERAATVKALEHARSTYNNLGGVKQTTPGGKGAGKFAYQIIMREVYPPGNAIAGQQKPRFHTLYGATPQEARKAAEKYKKDHPALTVPGAPDQSGYWDSPKGVTKGPQGTSSSSSGVVDRPSESTRRLRAWRTFKADLAAAGVKMNSSAMQALFRTQFGDPAR